MANLLIQYHLKKAELFSQDELAQLAIQALPGGTNDVYLVKVPHHPLYVMKIPKPATRQFINRKHEYMASMATVELEINIPFVYYDLESGIHLSRYIDSQPLNKALFQQPDICQQVANVLRKLHQMPNLFPSEFNIFSVISFYQTLIAVKLPPELNDILNWDSVIKNLDDEFSKRLISRRPCHCDPMFNNFLISKDKIYLIDWEYAGNNDPCWDIASLLVEAEFTLDQQHMFLDYYFQHPVDNSIDRRLQVYQVLSNYLWALWCIAMLETNDKNEPLYQHAVRRFQLFKSHIEKL